ncbi:fimbria/pilus outer membrane usher protein [Enterovibrio baiacu]|uniref:fimbria/pilus outer membrane usher protein n=1 Tax=Enterovibrio baiacu TaxID=2491023 RepID=UPI003D0A6ED9
MTIGERLRVVWLLLFVSFSVSAMTFTVPLSINDRELGSVPVSLSGMDVDAVSVSELKALLGKRVDAGIWQALSDEKSINAEGMVPLKTLAEKGVELVFDASTLSLSAHISSDAFGQANVDFGEGYEPFYPSESSTFSWLNSINFAHTESWEGDTADHFSSIDWLAQMNLGGASGINLDAANYFEVSDSHSQVLRGEWRFFYDNPNAPYRVSVGDVESGVSGYVSNMSLGGLSIESDYAELQPQRVIGPNNDQELILKESAEVEIVVNGQVIFSGRQDAGRFNLMNLPMDNGANDITVHVTYLSGKTETFVFTQFYNSSLLNEGMVNYAFSAGVPSVFEDKGISYLDTWAMNGFVEYGVSSWLTVGANGIAAKYGNIAGGVVTIGTDLGNLSSRFALSDHQEGETGNVVSVNVESAIIGTSESQTPNLRLGVEFADGYTASPWEEAALPVSYERYLANYVLSINDRWDVTFSGSYMDDTNDETQTNTTSMLNWKRGDITLGAGVSYTKKSTDVASDTRYFFTFDWRWNHQKYGYNLGASYNSTDNQTRVDMSRTNNERVGSVGFRALAEYDEQRDRQNAQLSYTANRVRLEGEVERTAFSDSNMDVGYKASIRGNTAIGIADGKIGWGRAKPGPFLVTQLHPSLADHEAHIGVAQDGKYKAAATSMVGGLLPLDVPYASNTVDLSVPNAPMGYDWGESRHTISPGAATGHVVMVGSDSSYTAKGVLLGQGGKPISYLQGELTKDGVSHAFFTNKTGRFFVQGVGPGTYVLTIGYQRYQPMTLDVEDADNRLIELGTLTMECIEENCDANP